MVKTTFTQTRNSRESNWFRQMECEEGVNNDRILGVFFYIHLCNTKHAKYTTHSHENLSALPFIRLDAR